MDYNLREALFIIKPTITMTIVLNSLVDSLLVFNALCCRGYQTGILPRTMIVPHDSGYPGFGSKVILEDQDHITICKLTDKAALGYRTVHEVVRSVLEQCRGEEA